MGFNTHSWNNPITLDANNLNRIEQGIKNSHDTIEIINEEVSNLQNRHADIVKDLNALTKDAPNIIETLNNISSLLKNNDISAVLSSADSFLMKTKQTLTASELDQIYKNLHMDKFLKLTSVKVDGNNVVNGSEINIVLPKIDDTLDINSSNAISNKAVTKALSNINIEVDVPTHLSQLQQDKDHLTVSIAEKTKWDSYKNILDNIRIEETDPTVPDWAKQPNKPEYNYSEIKNKPTGVLSLSDGNPQHALVEFDGTADKTFEIDIPGLEFEINANKDSIINLQNSVGQISDTIVDLTGKVNNKVDTSTLSSYYTSTQTDELLNNKATDTITEAKGYTDTKISDLIGGAPETLNTLKEIADAFAEDQEVLDALETAIGKKVDKVEGYGLSKNDYTDKDKTKLTNIAEGAEVNVQSDWNVTDTSSDAYIKNKPTIPSISGLATETYVNTQVNTLQGEIDGKQDKITDLDTIRSGASAGATAVQPSALDAQVSTLQGKIDAKYTKPVGGIPASDLAETYDTVTSVNNKTTTTLNTAKSYTDTKISDLIGSAPETLDTLQEVAKAIKDNEDVVAGLNSAIGTKADKTTVDSLKVQVNTNAAAISNTYTKNEVSAILLGYATNNDLTGKVDKTTTINSKPLSTNITLSASDVGALPSDTELFSGNYNDLTNKPTLFSGNYNDLSNKPTIPTTASDVSALPDTTKYGAELLRGGGLIDIANNIYRLRLRDQNGQQLGQDVVIDLSSMVQNTRKVAGVSLEDDITAEELSTALNLSQYANTVTSVNDKTGVVSLTAEDVGALPNTTLYGASLDLTVSDTDYKLTAQLKDQDGTVLTTKTIDLPIEQLVTAVSYDNTTKDLTITLQNGSTTTVPLDDIISGLVNDSRTIAGIDLKDDITVAEMQTALNVPKIQEYAFESTAWTADTANPGYYVLYIESFTSSDIVHSLGVFKTVTYSDSLSVDKHAIMTDILINTYTGQKPTVKLRTDNPFNGVFKYLLTKA